MIMFRCREPGDDEWTQLTISGELEESIASIIGSALETSPFIVQILPADETEWSPL